MYEGIKDIVSDKVDIIYDEEMSKHTSFKIGGKTDIFAVVDSVEDLIQIEKYAKENGIAFEEE